MQRKCKICKKDFYAKPVHVRNGYGIYCSRNCKNKGLQKGRVFPCTTCGIEVYKNPRQIKLSKSKKYFCSKSCQTIWRNKYFSGSKHLLWKGGHAIYRDKLLRNNKKPICILCGIEDIRVLAVHHVDKNRQNNSISNLEWLCHNCHYLVHSSEKDRNRFEL